MAAEIRPFPGTSNGPQKLQLISKLEGHQDTVNMAILLKAEDGIISISDDKYVKRDVLINNCIKLILPFFLNGKRTVRIWLKRDVGNYWPSVCHIMPCMFCKTFRCHDTRY